MKDMIKRLENYNPNSGKYKTQKSSTIANANLGLPIYFL